jgi:lipopolysaccharide export LptBFGC system permease protein LptF
VKHRIKEKSLLIEILKRTPPWVFFLFFVLLAVGYYQSKDRIVGRGKVAILPIIMIALSFYGVLSAFGAAPLDFFPGLSVSESRYGLGLHFALRTV